MRSQFTIASGTSVYCEAYVTQWYIVYIYLISSRIYMHTEGYICLYLCACIHTRVSYIIIKINVYI